jgi:hypothetical protein
MAVPPANPRMPKAARNRANARNKIESVNITDLLELHRAE